MTPALLQSNHEDSWTFLQRLHPGRLVTVTAISLDKRQLPTETFGPDQRAEFLKWIAAAEGMNCYYSLAEPLKRFTKKLDRADIKAVHYFHVDIDPRVNEPIDQERERILNLLRDPPQGIPLPTAIIDSGNGYQAIWKLSELLSVDGRLEVAEELKLYNLELERRFGADNCHDVSRILRLPDTINLPDAKKAKKGRVPTLAALVEWHDDRVYEVGQFVKVVSPKAGDGPAPIKAPANIKRLASVDELGDKVSNLCKIVIVNGHNPDDPNHFPSRSEAIFWACCELTRAGVDERIIFSVITDPEFHISESIREKGNGAERYALRQIERARDQVSDDPVSSINRDYFAATEGGRVTYYREECDGSVTPMNAEAFGFELAPRKVEVSDAKGNTRSVPAVDIWRASDRRRFYQRGFVLDPTYTKDDGRYNLWRGFGVPEAEGDWSLIRNHVEEVLADGNAEYADYIIRWTAWKLQNPGNIPRVALVFRGEEGIGKGFWGNGLVSIFGHHGLRVHSMMQVAGRFNAHMRHLCCLFADEATVVDEEQEGALKGIITEPTLPIEGKGKDIIDADNHLAVVMASNRTWCVPAGIGARRFAVFNVSAKRKGDRAYFDCLFGCAENGGWSAMLHDLRRMPLGKWHPESHRPNTAALAEQQIRSLKGLERVVAGCLHTGEILCGVLRGETVFVPTEQFCDIVAQRTRGEAPSPNEVQHLFGKVLGFVKDNTARPRGWVLPPLPEARAAWDRSRIALAWPDVDGWSVGIDDYTKGGTFDAF